MCPKLRCYQLSQWTKKHTRLIPTGLNCMVHYSHKSYWTWPSTNLANMNWSPPNRNLCWLDHPKSTQSSSWPAETPTIDDFPFLFAICWKGIRRPCEKSRSQKHSPLSMADLVRDKSHRLCWWTSSIRNSWVAIYGYVWMVKVKDPSWKLT